MLNFSNKRRKLYENESRKVQRRIDQPSEPMDQTVQTVENHEDGRTETSEHTNTVIKQAGFGSNQRAYPYRKIIYNDDAVQIFIQRDRFKSSNFFVDDHIYTIRATIKNTRSAVPTIRASLSAIVDGIRDIVHDLQQHYSNELNRDFNLVFYESSLER